MGFKRYIYNNSLMLAMFGIFLCAVIGMSVTGWSSNNNTLEEHRQSKLSYIGYLGSGEFIEGVFENWESEFLQMWALIILTVYLRQKGSADSKPVRGQAKQDTSSRYSIINAASWQARARAARHIVYSHSLGLAMLGLFMLSFLLHALGGAAAYNQENQLHGGETVTMLAYVGSSQFWYESLQNWQSEFLAIGALLVLSVKLRERGSPQSKPVGKAHDRQTG
jgi:hypothetical protein